ncbi:NUDIX domain-containing protein [Shewanella sp. NFH-SH190041]|uniref:nucleotide triphosphate diphosphatase NUDT15 n=1 Tax=Shewanella sp. NFH-SH190041 TaxID=2950245 RepID=UPI0021C32C2B|nr:NUDIX hydrolase [Shewanella sp. NFH-SH190041]BDM65459.1 NUDIX domain-containing protein [Shewanella sp. NFH-SH190041]
MSKQARVGVGVVIMRQGKVLLGLRQGSHGEGTWALPGGHLEWQESIEQCASREVKEETNLNVLAVQHLGFTSDVFTQEDKHYVTLFVTATVADGDAELMEPEKCRQWQWFEPQQLPSPLFLPFATLLRNQPDCLCD